MGLFFFKQRTAYEILRRAEAPAIVEARCQRLEAAAIDADLAALRERVATLGLDVDNTGGAQAILCRQRAGDQRQVADEIRREHMAEAGNAVGQRDAVD